MQCCYSIVEALSERTGRKAQLPPPRHLILKRLRIIKPTNTTCEAVRRVRTGTKPRLAERHLKVLQNHDNYTRKLQKVENKTEKLGAHWSSGVSGDLAIRPNSPAQFGSPGALPNATTTHSTAPELPPETPFDTSLTPLFAAELVEGTSLK